VQTLGHKALRFVKTSWREIINYDIAKCVGLTHTPDKKRGLFALIRHKKENISAKKEVKKDIQIIPILLNKNPS
jgi:hypothetical protein